MGPQVAAASVCAAVWHGTMGPTGSALRHCGTLFIPLTHLAVLGEALHVPSHVHMYSTLLGGRLVSDARHKHNSCWPARGPTLPNRSFSFHHTLFGLVGPGLHHLMVLSSNASACTKTNQQSLQIDYNLAPLVGFSWST
ncbi:hypothetical protein IAQ61_011278 [Plenodomus lingam]|uniref:uncharacterized protein n=1 Tax=Leptosphaeria maculans TaxID=5022 RepID=UPI003334691C|nr:hypothetical protein IAQ61_011278 [Plenodomus lingam]